MARSTRTADEYVASLRNGERFYAGWVLDWLREGGPSVAKSWREGKTSPPAYPARWSEAHAQGIAREVVTRYLAEQGEADEAAAARRYQAHRQWAGVVSEASRSADARARLEAALRYGRARRRKRTGMEAERRRRQAQARRQPRTRDGRFR